MNCAETINDWLIQVVPVDSNRVGLWLQVAGPPALAAYIQQNFPDWPTTGLQPPSQPPFHWSLAALVAESDVAVLRGILTGLTGCYLLAAGDSSPLTALLALEPHGHYRGEFQFSPGAQTVIATKRTASAATYETAISYWRPRLTAFIDSQPLLRTVQAISWIPSGEQSAERSSGAVTLVEQLAARLADQYGWRRLPLTLCVDQAQKRVSGPLARLLNVAAAFTFDPDERGQLGGDHRDRPRILLLDDVVASGLSLRQAGHLFKEKLGATVIGLALTRAYPHR